MKSLLTVLVLSAWADGTVVSGFLKGLALAGLPSDVAGLATVAAVFLVSLYRRWRNARLIDRKVRAAVAKHCAPDAEPQPSPKRRGRKALAPDAV